MPIWLLKIWNALKILWTWIKGNWSLLLLGFGLIIGFIFFRRSNTNYQNLYSQFQKQMEENRRTIDNLRQIQQEQLKKEQEIASKYREVLAKIEQNYQEQLQTLDAKKEKELKTIIATTKDDPNLMAQQINALFGIPLYTIQTQ